MEVNKENKENKENIALYHQRKRKKHKIKLAIATIILILIALILIGTYFVLNKKHSIKYTEASKIKYGVHLVENEFYKENYLETDIDVIADLIKNIDVQFRYNLELSEEVEYKYNYRILAETQVKEKSKTNLFYESEHQILNKTGQTGKSQSLEIYEKINLDYNKYNDQITKLIQEYKLANTASELHLNMYLTITDVATGKTINRANKVMSVVMPLTTKTVEITLNEYTNEKLGEISIQEIEFENSEYFLIAGVLILIIGLIILAKLMKYNLDTRSAEKMYEDELKKILFDYKSYIQKINNEVQYSDYKIIRIDTFKELLGMREELQAPILMYTEDGTRKTTFMMINGNLLFMHTLEATAIRQQLIKMSKEKKEMKERSQGKRGKKDSEKK